MTDAVAGGVSVGARHRVGLVDDGAVGAMDAILVQLAGPHLGQEDLHTPLLGSLRIGASRPPSPRNHR